MKRLIAITIAAIAPGFAVAAPAPTILPTQDVSVQYSLVQPGQPQQNFQFSYNAATQQARADSANGFYVLANLPQRQAQIVVPALHAIVQAPDFSNLASEFYKADSNNFTPQGTGHYAGLDCRKYLVTSKQGTANACITPDGVILHLSGRDAQGSAEVTAQSVTYAAQPTSNFVAPEGYAPLTLPPSALAALLQAH